KFDDDPTDGVVDSALPAHTAACNPTCPTLVAGKKGNAYQFTTDRIDVANTDLNPGQHFTVAAWIRVDSSTTENTVAVCEQSGANCTYGLMVAVNNKPAWYSDGPAQSTSTTTMALGVWYHTMMIWDGTNRITYVNGTMYDSQPASLTSASTKMTIGSRDFASSPLYFPGSIDEVVFYDRVLTASEIALLSAP
ncbi:MAG TPA: LamG domain-containing protein, partial [Kofleriaceae bacterium]